VNSTKFRLNRADGFLYGKPISLVQMQSIQVLTGIACAFAVDNLVFCKRGQHPEQVIQPGRRMIYEAVAKL
jgi:hypothetical protein